ncbi:DUF1778 domain-containing protein [Mesorhizobium sp. M1E.F.Ca.ET.041.01.1.1]|uniref:type II toxin -antitoxin system TacA 1-like antitoxin n=1 Tax=Mesorhizobium sp. M1E.F.Ca.ET.041.01.1.1 TaxID=2496759 RepID=UPI000FCBE1BB|nr:DUF1778 domain-containing protein [Mesorhizobium sp. M1E.F.Ca.ET.041.01.1.1]RUW29007.1 DUF1778 domain-containing protein [Mesorhizobium sp. M1E.F.Ca.ET.041.01.1.1]RWD92783.1 MAG: DUF1778 domain-containing protein [Mesorhizobium sp.]
MTKNATGSMQEEKLSIEDQRRLDLSVNDCRVFVEALVNPRPVNDRLCDTVRRHREATGV